MRYTHTTAPAATPYLAALFALTLCVSSPTRSFGQIFTDKNSVRLPPNASEKTVIEKAANVVPSARQLRWQQLEITGFLHFGVNTFTNKEWGDGTEDPKIFNPTALDARQWIRACREGGIKQVVITAKHHDGFCLWPSKYTEHSVKNSPWKNGKGDVVREVADACHEQGVGFGVYLSPWDRNSPYFGDSAKYNNYFVNQMTELLTNYGRVDEVWFDGANGEGPTGKKQVYDYNRWYALIRKLQPTAVISVMGPDVRWVGTESGYGRETEWSVVPLDEQRQDKVAANSQKDVAFAPKDMYDKDLGSRAKIRHASNLVWYPAEVNVSIRPGWFYHPAEDTKVKTPPQLLDIYYNSVGKNGVLLVNVPPNKEGLVQENDVRSLKEWKNVVDKTFANNLLTGANIKASTGKASKTSALLDRDYATYWTTPGHDSTAVLEFKLKSPQTFDIFMLQENITVGQRIEKFVLEYQDGSTWKKATEGTTVGYKRLLTFAPITAKNLRLRIESSRLNPTLSYVGLFKQIITPEKAN